MPESTLMKMPALAVVGPDRRIMRSTEAFRAQYENAEKMCEKSPELDRVLTGRADVATLIVGDLSVEIEAVTDETGHRQAMLSLPGAEPAPTAQPPVSALQAAAEDSPAMVWIKDLDGRYLSANRRFVSDLRTSEERLRGKSDRQLKELETVDGPRLRYAEDGLKEPLQLEYTVPAVDRRPALAVFRFPIRDENDQPVATCGVAAPVAEAQVAQDEMVRLMQLERWNRLDPVAVRAEVLEQWHVHAATARAAQSEADDGPTSPTWDIVAKAKLKEATAAEAIVTPSTPDPELPAPQKEAEPISRPTEATAAPTPAPPPIPSLAETAELLQANLELAREWAVRAKDLQDELQQAQAAAARAAEEADRSRAELEQAQGELAVARAETEALREPSSAARQLSEELSQAVAAERERGEELERMLVGLRSRLADLDSAFDQGASPAAHGVWQGSRRRRQ